MLPTHRAPTSPIALPVTGGLGERVAIQQGVGCTAQNGYPVSCDPSSTHELMPGASLDLAVFSHSLQTWQEHLSVFWKVTRSSRCVLMAGHMT